MSALMDVNIPWNLDHLVETTVKSVTGEIVLGHSQRICLSFIERHQSVVVLVWLDPLVEPAQGHIFAEKTLLD
jgi:hypothetical protein